MYQGIDAVKVVGQYPVSIATSVALEKLILGKIADREEVSEPRLHEFDSFWFNIKTLYRNLLGCIPGINVTMLDYGELSDVINSEMSAIKDIVNSASGGRCKVVFYISNYKQLTTKYRLASLRTDNTDAQKTFTRNYEGLIKSCIERGILDAHACIVFDKDLTPEDDYRTSNALMLTHITLDLLSHTKFRSLNLLESHTGAIKGRDLWYTKYYNGKTLPPLPMSPLLLPVFGDNEFFRPLNQKAKEDILELAAKYNWTPVTTQDKILYGVNTLRNPLLKDTIKTFL